MAEDTVDFVLDKMSFEERSICSPSDTKKPLNDQVTLAEWERLKLQSDALAEEYKLSKKVTDLLIWRHGNEFFDLAQSMQKYSAKDEETQLWMAEAEYAIKETSCLTLEDFYWRRSPLFLSYEDHGLKYLEDISEVFAEQLSLSPSQIAEQKSQLKMSMKKELNWRES